MKFTNKGNKTGEILIYEDIGSGLFGGIDAKQFQDELAALGDINTLDLRINSYGGEVFQGFAIHNALARHPAKINVFVDGIAASIASVIAMAGDSITMAKNSTMMIHEARAFAGGTARVFLDIADRLETLNEQISDLYQGKSKLPAAAINAWMDEEKYFTAQEALDAGLADEIEDYPVQIAAYHDRYGFKHAPPALQAPAEATTISRNDTSARAAVLYMSQNLRK